jgi:hypothetical protein
MSGGRVYALLSNYPRAKYKYKELSRIDNLLYFLSIWINGNLLLHLQIRTKESKYIEIHYVNNGRSLGTHISIPNSNFN